MLQMTTNISLINITMKQLEKQSIIRECSIKSFNLNKTHQKKVINGNRIQGLVGQSLELISAI